MISASLTNRTSILRAAGTVTCGLLFAICGFAQQQAVPNAAILDAETEAARRYSVELIVFEYAGDAANTTEIFDPDLAAEPLLDLFPGNGVAVDPAAWPDPEGKDKEPESDDRSGPATTAGVAESGTGDPSVLLPGEELGEIRTYEHAGVQVIPPEQYQLRAAYNKLVELDAYRPLMHAAWIQPVVAEAETEALKLRRIGDPPLRLDGTVALYLGRYLHLVIDLALEHKSPLRMQADRERIRAYGDSRSNPLSGYEASDFEPVVYYRIQEDRILRSNETRYFDHPKFGVIARVARIEEETPEPPDTTGDLLPGVN